MKRNNAIALFALAAWIAIPFAPAQEVAVRATVPFCFDVAGQVLPAGTYTLSSPLSHTLLIKRGAQATTAVFNDSSAYTATGPSADRGWLVFSRRGNQYSLKAVESSNASIHARLPQFHQPYATSTKRTAQAKGAKDNGTTVLVALR